MDFFSRIGQFFSQGAAEVFTAPALLSLLIIVIIEAILSIDNAAVLAVIVNKNLKDPVERAKAFKYGMLGAYVFRGLCLFLVAWLLNNPNVGIIFKVLGGLYLIKLAYDGLYKQDPDDGIIEEQPPGWADKVLLKLGLGVFWSTVVVVEIIDIVFSVDNLVAVVSLSKSMWVICIGVFIGIAVMRFVAIQLSKLMERFPSLEKSAYIVICLLGLKLALGGASDYWHFWPWLHHHSTDLWFSIVTMSIFFIPLLRGSKKPPVLVPVIDEHEEAISSTDHYIPHMRHPILHEDY